MDPGLRWDFVLLRRDFVLNPVLNPAIAECIAEGGTVVTATRRLARELRGQYDHDMVESGRKAWESADILTWDAWIGRCQELQPDTAGEGLTALNDAQLQLVWQEIVQDDLARHHAAEEPLWNVEATATAAIATLRRMREWRIPGDDLPPSRHPDHAGFRRWLRTYEARCVERGWTDRYRLPDVLAAATDSLPATPLLLAGFDILTAQQKHLIAALEKGGAAIEVLKPGWRDVSAIPCHAFDDADTQWRAAAGWAAKHMAASPTARLAIVVPDLAARRDEITETLTAVLAPDQAVNPGESRDLPFHVSLGDRLDAHPFARGLVSALDALTADSLTLEETESLLLSPVIGGHGEELLPRASAALALRERLPWNHDIDKLLRELSGLGCPLLVDRLVNARARVRETPAQAPLTALSGVILALTGDLGWPAAGQSLDSDQFQAREAILEQVLHLATLEMVHGETGLTRAVALLGRGLAAKTFQPESPETSLEVLDIREAAGLEFDQAWFADLTGEHWPSAPTPDPFLPVGVQRDAGCPDADVTLAHALAARRHARLAASTETLVQSRPRHDGDTQLMPSPLLGNAAGQPPTSEPAATLASRIQAVRASLDEIDDDNGPPHPGGTVSGGTGLVQRQSRCPRSAFLRDRLGAGDHAFNRPGLDPMRRGTLVHRVLDTVWRRLGDSATLAATDAAALDTLIVTSIDASSGRDRKVSGCGDAFFETQREWLRATLHEWFAIERARTAPFEVIGREEKVPLQLEGLDLSFRIDRMDRFADGSLALIDYKTGGGQSIANWFAERPGDPQLPLYVLSQAAEAIPVSVVAFARVRLGECALDGLLDPERHPDESGLGDHAGLKVNAPVKRSNIRDDYGEWTNHAPRWQATLGGLAREFLSGDARIDPGNGGVCRDCSTPAFCRSKVVLTDNESENDRFGDD